MVFNNTVLARMNMEKIIRVVKHGVLQLVIWGITYLICLYFKKLYFFGWLLQNKYIYIALFSAMFTLFGMYPYAYAVTFGNVIGMIAGELLGQYIHTILVGKITVDMNKDMAMVYRYESYYHVFIWLFCIVACFILAIVYEIIKTKSKSEDIL